MAEKEYIEREAVLAYMSEVKAACISNFEDEASAVIAGMIGEIKDDEIPAADVVEVVRCKDCKYRKTEDCAMFYECNCGEQHTWETDNDFCSYGERRIDNG